jgi:hypothetical protein
MKHTLVLSASTDYLIINIFCFNFLTIHIERTLVSPVKQASEHSPHHRAKPLTYPLTSPIIKYHTTYYHRIFDYLYQ